MKLNVDFAFEGFRIVRERPQVVLCWGLVMLIGNGLAMYAFMQIAGDAVAQMQAMAFHPATDPAQVMAVYQRVLPGYAVLLPVTIVINAIVSCAIFRVSLRDEAPGFGGILVGTDELRQLGLILLWWLAYIGLTLACGLVVGLLIAVMGIASSAFVAIGMAVGMLLAFGVIIIFIVRLSLCGVQTFDKKKINLFGSWTLTKPKWGTLMGGYLIAIVMAMLVYGLCMAIFAFIVAAVNGGNVAALSPLSGPQAMGADLFGTPVGLAYVVVFYGIVQPLMIAITVGSTAAAYKQLTGTNEGLEKVF